MANTQKRSISDMMEEPASLQHLIVATAISSLDFSRYKSYSKMVLDLCQRVDTVRDLLMDTSIPMRMSNAVKIPATIKEITFEESSQRYLITYDSDKKNEGHEGFEHIRSDRTDSRFGSAIKKMWSDVAPGDHVVIFKTNEGTDNPKKPTVRVAPYVKKLKPKSN